MTSGLFIGRFQPFHKGHLHAIKNALKEVDQLIIGIGSSQYLNTPENPFSLDERIEMIENTLAKENISNCTIYPIPDIGDDSKWVEHVKVLVPNFDIVFTGNDPVMSLFKKKGYHVKKVAFLKGINGTNVRDKITNNKDWRSLIPEGTAEVIDRINGIKRMKKIASR